MLVITVLGILTLVAVPQIVDGEVEGVLMMNEVLTNRNIDSQRSCNAGFSLIMESSTMNAQVAAASQDKRTGRQAGFGTLESMFAIVILTSAMLGLAASAIHVRHMVGHAHGRTAAMAQVRVQLETLMAQPYDSVTTGSAEADGVEMDWTVATGPSGKGITFVYQYQVRGLTKVDTLAAAVRR